MNQPIQVKSKFHPHLLRRPGLRLFFRMLAAVILSLAAVAFATDPAALKAESDKLMAQVSAIDKKLAASQDTSEYNALLRDREALQKRLSAIAAELNQDVGAGNQALLAFNTGNRHLKAGSCREAIDAYRQAISLDAANPIFHYNLGLAYQLNDQDGEALAAFEKCLTVDPAYVNAHVAAGNILAGQSRLDEAVAHYNRALKLDSTEAKGHLGLGNLHLKNRQFPDAEASFKRAVTIDDGYGEAWIGLGRAQHEQGRNDDAVKSLEKGLQQQLKKSHKIQGYYYLASAHNQSGNHDAAIAAAEKCLQLSQNYAAAWYEKGFALMKLGRKKEAAKAFEEARKDATWKAVADAQIKILNQ